jgi:hypothetical protein
VSNGLKGMSFPDESSTQGAHPLALVFNRAEVDVPSLVPTSRTSMEES